MKMESKRIDWIDWCKGLGILLVMFAHAPVPFVVTKYISTFVVPLFFFLNGYIFSYTKYNGILSFAKRKAQGLIIPYFSFALINFIFMAVLALLNKFSVGNLCKALGGIVFLIRSDIWNAATNSLWFLICLFITEIIFYTVVKLTKNSSKAIGCLLISLSIIGYLYGVFIKVTLPLCMDIWIITIVFYGAGYIAKEKLILEKISRVFIAVFAVINVLFGMINDFINLYENTYGSYFLFYLSAFAGIYTVIMLIRLIKSSSILIFFGQNTVIYLGLHFLVVYSLIDKVLKLTSANFFAAIFIGMIYLSITVMILIPVINLINNCFPWIVGKKLAHKEKSKILIVS